MNTAAFDSFDSCKCAFQCSMFMPKSIMNCTDLSQSICLCFEYIQLNWICSISRFCSVNASSFLVFFIANAKKPISLSTILLSIARPNLPVQQTIIEKKKKKKTKNNAIKFDEIDWGCGKLLTKTKETFITYVQSLISTVVGNFVTFYYFIQRWIYYVKFTVWQFLHLIRY